MSSSKLPIPAQPQSHRSGPGWVISICPTGLIVALVAHLVLAITAIVLMRHHRAYLLAALSYTVLALLLGVKLGQVMRRNWRRAHDQRTNMFWGKEFE